MKRRSIPPTAAAIVLLGALSGIAIAAQDRYSLQVPGGLAFADFRGYEDWSPSVTTATSSRPSSAIPR